MVLGRGVQLHPGGASSSAAVHHRLLSATPGRIQHPMPLFPDHRGAHTQHAAHRTHVVSKKTQKNTGMGFIDVGQSRSQFEYFPQKHRLDG